jgi:hypothetical protein
MLCARSLTDVLLRPVTRRFRRQRMSATWWPQPVVAAAALQTLGSRSVVGSTLGMAAMVAAMALSVPEQVGIPVLVILSIGGAGMAWRPAVARRWDVRCRWAPDEVRAEDVAAIRVMGLGMGGLGLLVLGILLGGGVEVLTSLVESIVPMVGP